MITNTVLEINFQHLEAASFNVLLNMLSFSFFWLDLLPCHKSFYETSKQHAHLTEELCISLGRPSYFISEQCLLCSYAASLLTCSSCSPTTDLEALEPRKKFNPCCLLTPPPPPLFPPPPSLWHKPRVCHVTPAPAVAICPWIGSMNPVVLSDACLIWA